MCYTFIMESKLKSSEKKIRSAVTKAAVGTVTAASVLTGSLFDDPGDILSPENPEPDSVQQAITETRYPGQTQAAAAPTVRERIRSAFLRMPTAVRALVLLPLWCVGTAVLSVTGLLLRTFAPFWKILLMFALEAGLLFGLFAFVYHLIFPNRPIRNLLKKENLFPLLFLAAFLAITDYFLSRYYEQYRLISGLVKIALGFLVLFLLCHRFFHTARSDRKHVPADRG